MYVSNNCLSQAVNGRGISLLGIFKAAGKLGLHTLAGKGALEQLAETPLSSILHWNQPPSWYFTKSRRTKVLLADPDKELVVYSKKDMEVHWVSTHSNGEEKGIPLFLA